MFIPADKLRPEEITDDEVREALEELVVKWDDRYCRFPDRDDKVIELIRRRGKALILGRARVGKTRLAIEAARWLMRNEPEYKDAVFVIVKKDIANNECPVRKKWWLRKYPCVFLFFDGLNKYINIVDVVGLVRRFRKVAERVIVLATCRTSEANSVYANEALSKKLFPRDVRIVVREFSEDEGRELARKLSKPFNPDTFDGTPESILRQEPGGLISEYMNLSDEGKSILKVLKLLHFGEVSCPRKKSVELIWRKVFNITADFGSCYTDVEKRGFLRPAEEDGIEVVALRKPALQVISDYEPTYDDLRRALDALYIDEGAWRELFYMGVAFLRSRGYEEEAVRCFTHVIENGPKEWRATAYYNRGVAYGRLGRRHEAYRDFEEAMKLNPAMMLDFYGVSGVLDEFEKHWELLVGYPEKRAKLAMQALDALMLLKHWGTQVPMGKLDKWLNRAKALVFELSPRERRHLAAIEKALRRTP